MDAPRPWRLPRYALHHPATRTVALGLLGALLAVQLFAALTFDVDAFRLRLAVGLLDTGQTVIAVPPFGTVAARTHAGPLGLTVTLVGVDVPRLERLVAGFTRAQVVPAMLRTLRRDVVLMAAWTLALASLGGAGLPWLTGERQRRRLLGGASAGLAGVGAIVLLTLGTYRPQAFQQPRYTGALQAAPFLVGIAQEGFGTVRSFEAQMGAVAANLDRLFAASRQLQPLTPQPGRVTVMLVSDIHNNPLAYDLIDRLLPSFRPDFIIDSGDLTDLGTSLEATQLSRIAAFGVPYLFAAGNHEAPAEMAELARVRNVVILDGQEVVEDGVGVVGVRDPSSYRAAPTVPAPAELAAAAERLAAAVAAAPVPVTVAVAHEPAVVQDLFGRVPLVVNGHTHSIWIRTQDDSVWLNPGTTGAAGIREVAPEAGGTSPPYSLMLVYLDPAGGGRFRVRAVDTVRLSQVEGALDLERRLFPLTAATTP